MVIPTPEEYLEREGVVARYSLFCRSGVQSAEGAHVVRRSRQPPDSGTTAAPESRSLGGLAFASASVGPQSAVLGSHQVPARSANARASSGPSVSMNAFMRWRREWSGNGGAVERNAAASLSSARIRE